MMMMLAPDIRYSYRPQHHALLQQQQQQQLTHAPVSLAPKVPTFPPSSSFPGRPLQPKSQVFYAAAHSTTQPVHLLEQEHAQRLLQQEQEVLQRQKLYQEFVRSHAGLVNQTKQNASLKRDAEPTSGNQKYTVITSNASAIINHPLAEYALDEKDENGNMDRESLGPRPINALQAFPERSSMLHFPCIVEQQPIAEVLPLCGMQSTTTSPDPVALDLSEPLLVEQPEMWDHPLSDHFLAVDSPGDTPTNDLHDVNPPGFVEHPLIDTPSCSVESVDTPSQSRSMDHVANETQQLSNDEKKDNSFIETQQDDDDGVIGDQIHVRHENEEPAQYTYWEQNRAPDSVQKIQQESPPTLVPCYHDSDSSSDSPRLGSTLDVVPAKMLTDANSVSSNQKSSVWSSEAVEAVSSTVSHALEKLKSLATHISKTSGESAPDAVNTSTESLASSNEKDSSSSGLDMNELEKELRGTKVEAGPAATEEASLAEKQNHRRNNNGSIVSVDTLGTPKPATLAACAIPPQHLQKPVPLSPCAISTRRDQTRFVLLNDLSSKCNISPTSFSTQGAMKSFSSINKRAVTPIMRMRSRGDQEIGEIVSTPDLGIIEESKPSLTDEEYRAKKQRQWKKKMKIAQRERDGKREKLDRQSNIKKRRHNEKRKKSRDSQLNDSFYSMTSMQFNIPSEVPSCKNDISTMLESFFRTRCGSLNDTFFDGDEDSDSDDSMEGSTNGGRDHDEDESVVDSETSMKRSPPSVATPKTTQDSINDMGASTCESKSIGAIEINDKQFIRHFINSATNNGFFIMLHKMNSKKSLSRPLRSIAFVLRGVQGAAGHFKGPKLFWKVVDRDEIGTVDLFDIRSLDKATALELENYPLAMPGRCFILRMNKGTEYVFEARNEGEALRLVHGMRWIIARLSFNLIVGNVGVCCELLDVNRPDEDAEDCHGKFPSTLKDEAQWTMAMNDVTSYLVDKATSSIL